MITFQCECGKNHSIADEHAGKRGKCSGCGNVMRIPGLQPAAARTRPPVRQPVSAVASPPQSKTASALDEGDSAHLYGVDDPDFAPRASTPRGRPCPKCTRPLPSPDATFCVDCGYNLKTGKVSSLEVVKPSKPKKRQPSHFARFVETRLTSSKFVGGLLSLIGGTVWLVLGLMANRIFFYPIFLIVGGFFGVLFGLIDGDD